MPISEVEDVAIVVATEGYGGEIKPQAPSGVGDEATVIDAALVLLDQNP
jgi:hypothetical protein